MATCWSARGFETCASQDHGARASARVLLPLVTREILFRLLAGDQGARLWHIAVLGGHTNRIAGAIERLRHDFDKPLRMEESLTA